MSKKPTVLLIMDGFGLAPAGPENAISCAKTPNLDKLFAECPNTQLQASGLDVGLPAGQRGRPHEHRRGPRRLSGSPPHLQRR